MAQPIGPFSRNAAALRARKISSSELVEMHLSD
jgi:hypothetical protein